MAAGRNVMIQRSFSMSGSRQRGFSLIEVIAAFLLFALGFGVLLEILTGSLRIAHRSSEYTQATLWAESRLDQVGVGETLEEGDDSGRFDDDYRWTMSVTKVDPPMASMGVDGTANADDPRQAGIGRRDQAVQPISPTAAGVEQETGIDLYQVRLTVYWGAPGREQHADYTTLRAVDSTQNQLHPFGRVRGGRSR